MRLLSSCLMPFLRSFLNQITAEGKCTAEGRSLVVTNKDGRDMASSLGLAPSHRARAIRARAHTIGETLLSRQGVNVHTREMHRIEMLLSQELPPAAHDTCALRFHFKLKAAADRILQDILMVLRLPFVRNTIA